jgi:glutamine synthetase type III
VRATAAAGGGGQAGQKKLLRALSAKAQAMMRAMDKLAATLGGEPAGKLKALSGLRAVVDELEGTMPADQWPLPSYAQMFFMI